MKTSIFVCSSVLYHINLLDICRSILESFVWLRGTCALFWLKSGEFFCLLRLMSEATVFGDSNEERKVMLVVAVVVGLDFGEQRGNRESMLLDGSSKSPIRSIPCHPLRWSIPQHESLFFLLYGINLKKKMN